MSGYSLTFDGVNKFLSTRDSVTGGNTSGHFSGEGDIMSPTGKGYMVAWIKSPSIVSGSSGGVFILNRSAIGAPNCDMGIFYNDVTKGVSFFVPDGSSSTAVSGSIDVTGDDWKMVLGVVNGSNISVYVNNVKDATIARAGGGGFMDPDGYWSVGAIDSLGIGPLIPYKGQITECACANAWTDETEQDLADRLYNLGTPLDLCDEAEVYFPSPGVCPPTTVNDFGVEASVNDIRYMLQRNMVIGDSTADYPVADIEAHNVGAGLKIRLESNTNITFLVGDRIYPGVAPTSAKLPYITYEQISNPTTRHMTAASKPSRATYQINCWAETRNKAFRVADSVREAIDGFLRGKWGVVDVTSVTIKNVRDDFNKPDDGSQDGTHRRMVDVDIWHERSVPTF